MIPWFQIWGIRWFKLLVKSDTPLNQSSALVERFSVHSTDYYCLTRGHVLSDKGTFCRTRGHFCRTRGTSICRTREHLVKTSLWPQQASGARYQSKTFSKTWRQAMPAYMQSFIQIGSVVSDNKRDIVQTDLLIYYSHMAQGGPRWDRTVSGGTKWS